MPGVVRGGAVCDTGCAVPGKGVSSRLGVQILRACVERV